MESTTFHMPPDHIESLKMTVRLQHCSIVQRNLKRIDRRVARGIPHELKPPWLESKPEQTRPIWLRKVRLHPTTVLSVEDEDLVLDVNGLILLSSFGIVEYLHSSVFSKGEQHAQRLFGGSHSPSGRKFGTGPGFVSEALHTGMFCRAKSGSVPTDAPKILAPHGGPVS
jgi:hypothetical protein